MSGFQDYLTVTAAPNRVLDFKFDEASGTIANFGTATLASLDNISGTPTYSQTGDVSYETDDAILLAGVSNSWMARSAGLNPAATPNMATGSIGIVVKTNVATSNSYTQGDIMFCTGSSSTTAFNFLKGVGTGASTRIEWRSFNTGTGYEAHTRCQNVGGLDDDNYHMIIVTQAGDGTGPLIYVDGVFYDSTTGTGAFTNYASGGTINDWYDDKPTQGRIAIGSAAALGNNLFDGTFSRFWISTDVMTPAHITNLQTLRGSASLQSGANKRRRGRKFFTLGA